MKNPKEHLFLREWLVIALAIGFFVSIGLIAKLSTVSASSYLSRESSSKKMITITLKGAVVGEREYTCLPGTTLKELLKRVKLRKNADRKTLPLKKVLFTSQTIEIPAKKAPVKGKEERKKKI